MKIIRALAAFVIIFLFPLGVYAAYDYTIDSFQIMMTVNENNTFNIIENITANFHKPRHGIIRTIPLRNVIERLDGTKSRNRARISDIQVNEKFTVRNESGNKALKIGNPDEKITGNKHYTIQYTYDIGKDTGKGYDELYFNLIGTEWDTSIANIFFIINMPKSFNIYKLGFSAGALSSTNSNDIEYSVQGNVISGRYNGILNPQEGLTVRLELPEGYFVNAASHFNYLMIPALLLPVILAAWYYLIWRKYGKSEPVVETVEFYPPDGLNSVDIAYWYSCSVGNQDIISLLIYLANKGHLKISENESLKGKQKGFRITKIKDYEGDNENEKIFLAGLFQSGGEVTEKELSNKFYRTLSAIKTNVNTKINKERVYEKESLKQVKWGILIAAAVFILISVVPVAEYESLIISILSLIFPGISLLFFINSFAVTKEKIATIFILFFCIPFGIIPWYFMILPAIRHDAFYIFTYCVGIACIIAIAVSARNMPKRTPLGHERLGKIRGFRNFLNLAEKPKLEELVAGDPEYFYNILPYTYVLGLSDKWIKKFETIAMQPPDWYSGRTRFSSASFGSFIRSTMTSANNSMSSSPRSSSGSGGGSSGRGSGGGGGRSW
jgi:uncharacterized membrane protein YgcG